MISKYDIIILRKIGSVNMPLSQFHIMTDDEIAGLHLLLADNYFDYELYKFAFEDDKKRKQALEHLFHHFIKAIKPYCYFLSDKKENASVIVVWDSTLENPIKYHAQLLWMNLKMLSMLFRLRSIKTMKHVISCWDIFTSRWRYEFVKHDYLHLELFFTKKDKRGQGIGADMLKSLTEYAESVGKDLTVEVHREEYIPFYRKAGFQLMSEISHTDYDLRQYNFIKKCKGKE